MPEADSTQVNVRTGAGVQDGELGARVFVK